MKRRRVISLVAGGLLALSAALVATSGAAMATAPDTVKICHATNSNSNPYVVNNPAKDGDVSGHADHTGPIWYDGIDVAWGDIIPPFEYDGGSYPGMNWDATGQAIWNNDCEIPDASASPSESPSATESTQGETATPEQTQTPFESFEGETGTPAATPPPTSTGGSGPLGGSTPLFALLISFAFGGLGLTAVEAQRRAIRR
jgi:hypothetical protein